MHEWPLTPSESGGSELLWRDAEYVVNAMWLTAMDKSGLPLSADLSFQAWSEDLKRRKSDFARALFDKAREGIGEEKLRASQTLWRLTRLLNDSERQMLLSGLMTTQEAVNKLVRVAEEQEEPKKPASRSARNKLRKAIDRLLNRDDDFDERP